MKFFVHTLLTLAEVLLTSGIGARGSAAVTLYDVEFPDGEEMIPDGVSRTVSAVSTDSNGGTVYEAIYAQTEQVVQSSFSTPITTSNFAFTLTMTLVQGANYVVRTVGPSDGAAIVESCSFQGTTQGGCVYLLLYYATGGSVTATSPIGSSTGVPTPIFTLIELSSTGTTSIPQAGGGIVGTTSTHQAASVIVGPTSTLQAGSVIVGTTSTSQTGSGIVGTTSTGQAGGGGGTAEGTSTHRAGGVIVGAVIGAIIGVLILAFAILLFWRRKQKQRSLIALGAKPNPFHPLSHTGYLYARTKSNTNSKEDLMTGRNRPPPAREGNLLRRHAGAVAADPQPPMTSFPSAAVAVTTLPLASKQREVLDMGTSQANMSASNPPTNRPLSGLGTEELRAEVERLRTEVDNIRHFADPPPGYT